MINKCEYCGKEFESKLKKKVCSNACRHKRDRCQGRYDESNRDRHLKELYVCKHCGKEFFPKGYDRTTNCSRECAFEDMRLMKEQREKEKMENKIIPICIVCGKQFEGRIDSKYCSDECYKVYERNKYLKWKQTDDYRETLNKRNYKYKTDPHTRDVSLNNRHKRRIRFKNQFVENVSFNDICVRDKGKCQLCGKSIDMAKKWPHPNSASLDHIVPLALGGTHEYRNIQLAHLSCNISKGCLVISN